MVGGDKCLYKSQVRVLLICLFIFVSCVSWFVSFFWWVGKGKKQKASDSDGCIYHFSVVLSRPRLEGRTKLQKSERGAIDEGTTMQVQCILYNNTDYSMFIQT